MTDHKVNRQAALVPVTRDSAVNQSSIVSHQGIVRCFLNFLRHLFGLLAGTVVARANSLSPVQKRGLRSPFIRLAAILLKPFLDRRLAGLPFAAQFRHRLEMAGPTYVKFGQIMAVREDMLPKSVTDELKNLFERLPEIPFEQICVVIEDSLGQPIQDLFKNIERHPLGSASLAQVHRAETKRGDKVVLKIIKPGVREAMKAELRLLKILGRLLQRIIPQYQPRYIIEEFCTYTIREIDLNFEAENGEFFAANFQNLPDIVFPKMYRELSGADVLTMDYLEGFKPGSPASFELSLQGRERIIDLGADSILRMLYQHGFFHADLHAGNLMILPGDPIRIGFIDLGMVGRFEDETKRRMLYYFYALVNGDIRGATKYLCTIARVGEGGDMQGFRRAVMDLSRRFIMHSSRGEFSIARLILESMGLGGRYRVFFRVELILMVKALITFEGVGRMMNPELDVVAVSKTHMGRIFREHFHPSVITRELLSDTLRNSPEVIDLVTQLPDLLSDGLRYLEESSIRQGSRGTGTGLRSGIVAGACIVGGVLALVEGGPVLLWIGLFLMGFFLYKFGG